MKRACWESHKNKVTELLLDVKAAKSVLSQAQKLHQVVIEVSIGEYMEVIILILGDGIDGVDARPWVVEIKELAFETRQKVGAITVSNSASHHNADYEGYDSLRFHYNLLQYQIIIR